MASAGKKKTTMAKLARESRLRERRLEKQARKDARKQAAAHPPSQPGDPSPAASSSPAGCLSALPLGVVLFARAARCESSEHHDAFGIDRDTFAGLSVGQPRELHDRPTRRVEDDSLDILGVALHAAALAG